MSALTWLNAEAFTVFGQKVIWSDMIGNLMGLAALAPAGAAPYGPGPPSSCPA